MKIVFMGTPEFALPCLNILANSHHEIIAIVTTPDRPAGRGLEIRESPVKKIGLRLNVPILQPENLRDEQFIDSISKLNPDLIVVVAFRILPPEIFELPPLGTVNLHASILPRYRGAAPINWVIINGEKETGVTTFIIKQKVDTGDMILQKKVAIEEDETAGELHDKLAAIGADLLLESVNLIEKDKAPRIKQIGEVTKAPKIKREHCLIDWRKKNYEIGNLVRGVNPVPGAHTHLNDNVVKIFRTELVESKGFLGVPGEILKLLRKQGEIQVATGSGSLTITELQPSGKRKMSAGDFLLGHRLKVGDKFGKN